MGNRPIPKSDDRRIRRNARSVMALREVSTPEVPKGFLKATQEQWRIFWESELAGATRDAHHPMITRLFKLYDERERAYRTVRRDGRVTTGSQGQIVPHPMLKYIAQCDAEARQLEDRVGLSPRGMAALGSAFAGAQKSLDDLNRSMEVDESDDDDTDPRIEVVAG